MVTFLKTRPVVSVLLLIASICVPLIANRSDTSAQSAQKSCASGGVPAIVKSTFSANDPTKQVGIFIFPHTTTGDTYLQSLSGAATSVGNAGTLQSSLSAIGQQFTNQANLKMNLQSLYASMYGVGTNAKGNFQCAGLPPGSYTLLALIQPNPGAAPTANPNPRATATFVVPGQSGAYSTISSPGNFVVPSQSQALASVQTPHRLYYYSWVVITQKNMQPVPTPTPKNAKAPAADPTYAPVPVHRFVPIAQFPANYFSGKN